MKLVIVESPTKAKTIKKYLPANYVVESSFGHIRDLPKSATEIPAKYKKESWARLGIDIEHDFTPLYVIPRDKSKHISKLKKLLAEADEIFLATDEDREGEAISWHLVEVLKPTVPIKRMVFHEITKEAILHALEQTRTVDMHLVEAQETRRILDRLYGYEISPILWRKVAPKLSAGRVQSAALFLIVMREKERMAFRSKTYWDVQGVLRSGDSNEFEAKLIEVAGQRIATSVDFVPTTGDLTVEAKQKNVLVLDDARARDIAERGYKAQWTVVDVQRKPITSSPKPPFITSTLQQEAGRKLGWPASKTMRTAQHLYERGFITYMRTDSVNLSEEAITAARGKVSQLYGHNYLPEAPRRYKGSKSAQEAHEAIRPAGTLMRTVEEVSSDLDTDEQKLYELIWKRTVSSQMSDARLEQTSARLQAADLLLSASGRTIIFPGYFRAYVEGSDDPESDLTDREKLLPQLEVGNVCSVKTMDPIEHATKPPARYTEASLVKDLEQRGIGRPSTYASIIETIQYRGYVYKAGHALIPRFVAFAVVGLLHEHFPDLVNTKYTAAMEEDLDAIAEGQKDFIPYLKSFYFGVGQQIGLHDLLKKDIDARATCTIPLGKDDHDRQVNVRVGRYGPFVEVLSGETSLTASIPDTIPPDELTIAKAVELAEQKAEGPKPLGTDPVTGKPVYVLVGRFGPYVQLGDKITEAPKDTEDSAEKITEAQQNTEATNNPAPKKPKRKKKPKLIKPKMKGLLKGMEPATVTLETALQLLSLPKSLGKHPTLGVDVLVDVGRFGPYIKCGDDNRSIPTTDDVLTITLERTLEILATPKGKRGGRPTALKTLGEHPETKEAIAIMNGRYGLYIKCGKTNASLPKDTAVETVTLEQAVSLIDKRR